MYTATPGGPPRGPPGGPLQGNDLFFCRGMIHEISIYNRQISISANFDLKSETSVRLRFLSERSVLCFFLFEDNDLCLSDSSELLFVSFGLVKDGTSRLSCLACWFRYCRIALSGLHGSQFWDELGNMLLQCLFIEFGLIEVLNLLDFSIGQTLTLKY